jgi:hypothetical protein
VSHQYSNLHVKLQPWRGVVVYYKSKARVLPTFADTNKGQKETSFFFVQNRFQRGTEEIQTGISAVLSI